MKVLANKKALCTTDPNSFTDIQAVGSDDIYNRFESVFSVIQRNIDKKYWSFLSQPIYSDTNECITWYTEEWHETPQNFCELDNDARAKYEFIKNETITQYKTAIERAEINEKKILNDALVYIFDEFLFCFDNKVVVVAWGMRPRQDTFTPSGLLTYIGAKRKCNITFESGELGSFANKYQAKTLREEGHHLTDSDCPKVIAHDGYKFKRWTPNPIGCIVNQELYFVAEYEEIPQVCHVQFRCDEHCQLSGCCEFDVPANSRLNTGQIPIVTPADGYEFIRWDFDTDSIINANVVFTAVTKPRDRDCNILFDAGENGTISGKNSIIVSEGQRLNSTDIPKVKAKRGYKFTGWDKDPINCLVNKDTVFTAQYKEKWWKRIWNKKWLRWLLLALLILLLILLISTLFRKCKGSGTIVPRPIDIVNPETGKLPEYTVTPPLIGDDGKTPLPIIENDNAPDVIANRLNLYFEDDQADLNKFAKEFKEAYPSDEYKIIGCDDNVKWIQIQIPENDRNKVRNEINSKIPNQPFFIVDESLFEIKGTHIPSSSNPGWHLDAINADAGWEITKGSSSVVVAIIDDGCDVSHPMLKGKITKAYNVFTRNDKLNQGSGHGTATASVAAGNGSQRNKGLAGIATNCKIMPIQVFDHNMCSFSSLVNGIMYAIHQGANVVNISITSSFPGLEVLPPGAQSAIAQDRFKAEERVWQRVFNVANKKNTILVFAAGNDNILACIPPEHRSSSIVTVAAVDKNFHRTGFTNYSIGHSISAPGVDIYAAANGGKYQYNEGTSFSAPMVSGAIALMKSLNSNLTVDNVIAILQKTGKPVGGGICPVIQLDKALEMVRSGEIPERQTPVLDPETGCVVFMDDDEIPDGVGDAVVFEDRDGNTIGVGTDDDAIFGTPDDNSEGIGSGSGDRNGAGSENGNGNNNGSGSGKGNDIGKNNQPGVVKPNQKKDDQGTDYDYIRRLIKQYKEKIKELEGQLPENQKK